MMVYRVQDELALHVHAREDDVAVGEQKMVRMSSTTWAKLKCMAKLDRRTLGQEMDVILDDVMAERNVDIPEITIEEP